MRIVATIKLVFCFNTRRSILFGLSLLAEWVPFRLKIIIGRTALAGEAARRGFPIFMRAARNPCAPLARRARTADKDIFYADILLHTAHKP